VKPIRLALSGSGFKFPAHVGALMAVRDAGYTPIEFAGTSGGSIVAALAAADVPLDWMQRQALERDWSDMLTFSPWSLLTNMGYCSGGALLDWMREFTGRVTFAELPRRLTIMASEVGTATAFTFSRDHTPDCEVALAARASAAIPFAYAPVQRRGAFLMDGGMVNNIPADKLTVDDVPRLGVQLVSKQAPLAAGVHTFVSMIPRLLNLMLSANENTHVSLSRQMGACISFVETGYASGLDRNMPVQIRERLMFDGYTAVAASLLTLEAEAAERARTAPAGCSIGTMAATLGAGQPARALQPV
jgi:NTE family protein